jgi:hypothetical protein
MRVTMTFRRALRHGVLYIADRRNDLEGFATQTFYGPYAYYRVCQKSGGKLLHPRL